MTKHIKKNWHKSFFIETDYKVPTDFWADYFNGKWEDSNQLYSEYVDEATGGKEMNVSEIMQQNSCNRGTEQQRNLPGCLDERIRFQ